MRRGRIPDLVHRRHDGVERRVVADRQVCAVEVVVDRAREAYDGDVKFVGELPCTRQRSVASDHDQRIDPMGAHRLVGEAATFGGAELWATGGLEDRTPTLDDIAHVLRLEFLDLSRDQSLVASVDPLDSDPVVDSGASD